MTPPPTPEDLAEMKTQEIFRNHRPHDIFYIHFNTTGFFTGLYNLLEETEKSAEESQSQLPNTTGCFAKNSLGPSISQQIPITHHVPGTDSRR